MKHRLTGSVKHRLISVHFFMRAMAKKENPEMLKINRKFSKSKKHPVLTTYRYKKTAEKQSIYYLSTILALTTRKTTSNL